MVAIKRSIPVQLAEASVQEDVERRAKASEPVAELEERAVLKGIRDIGGARHQVQRVLDGTQ